MSLLACDECGWGSIAGPLFVCGVKASPDWKLDGLNDSKKLSPIKRQSMYSKLMQCVERGEIAYHIAQRSNDQIDTMGCYIALKDAYVEVFKALGDPTLSIIVDGNLKFKGLGIDTWNVTSIIKADTSVPACMAASIIGKFSRDRLMIKLSEQFPQYGWDKNFGYGAPAHLENIKKYGVSSLHRKSYEPIKSIIQLQRK